jgi:4-hydroxybenzoate polyprenyltransferase
MALRTDTAGGNALEHRPSISDGVRTTEGRGLGPARLAASISRLHIVVIACLATLTFGWIFTGRHLWALAAICALDWFLVNLLNRVVDRREDTANAIVGSDFVARHQRAFSATGLAVLVLSLPALYVLVPALTPPRLVFHLLGLAYNWPLLPGGRRIKQLYFWKNFASASGFLITLFAYPLAWTWSAGQPLAPGVSPATIAVAALFFLLFEISYEVIYDLRDAPGDRLAGVRTYPVVHGERVAVQIVDALLAAAVATLVTGYLARVVPWRMFVMVFAPLIQLALYKRAQRRGITSADCIALTWLGAALLLVYHVWVLLRLPGVGLP